MTPLAVLVGEFALAMRKCSKMVITAVNGVAAGAGANLALNGDFVLCTESALFLQAFANVGLVPDTGGSFLLPRTVGVQRAMRFLALAESMSAAEAEELGLVYKVVRSGDLLGEASALAERLASGPTLAYANLKKQIYEANFGGYERYLKEVELPTQNACAATKDFREGIFAFMEKRNPHFIGE